MWNIEVVVGTSIFPVGYCIFNIQPGAALLATTVTDPYLGPSCGETTAKAAARLSVAESDVHRRQFTDRSPSREFTRGNNRSVG